jgi:type I restriction enzyme R subunit
MRIEWEYDLVERPFCEQLQRMGWEWIEGDPDLPETTERSNSSEVLLKGRPAAALRKLNLRDGQPWLDDARIARAIRDLERAAGHRLLEINQSATELLLKGTVAEELGVLPALPAQEQAAEELATLGPEQGERAGTPLFFRKPEQRPAETLEVGGLTFDVRRSVWRS